MRTPRPMIWMDVSSLYAGMGHIDPLGTLLSAGQFSVRVDCHPLLFIDLGFLYFVSNCATLLLDFIFIVLLPIRRPYGY